MPEKVVEQHEPGLACPVCRVALAISERQNIEIDYCPKCRGVWLDRGELDKIIERSAPASSAPDSGPATQPRPGVPPQPQPDPYYSSGGHRSDGHGSKHGGGHGRSDQGYGHGNSGYRRKSWLSEIFD